MGIPRKLRAAALIAAAVLLGLLTVQGSYALWAANASAAPGTLSSASFNVSLAGQPSAQSTNMTLAGGQSAHLSLTTVGAPLAGLTPGTAVYASVTAANNSDAGGPFSISITAGAAALTNVGSGSLAQYLTVNTKTAAFAADCSSASGYTPLTATGFASSPIQKGGTAVLCFEVRLAGSAPYSVKGQAVTISLPLTAHQLCGVPNGCA
jgi:hypothetical protein